MIRLLDTHDIERPFAPVRTGWMGLAALALAGVLASGCFSVNLPFFQQGESAMADIVEAPDVAHYQFYLGREAFRQAEYKDALRRFRAAARLQPDFFEAHVGAGHALMELERAAAARRAYETAQGLKDTPEVRLYLARAALFGGELADASALAESAREDHPQPARVLEMMGAIAYKRGRLDEAARLWTEALEEDQSNEALQALLADLLQYLKSYPRAGDSN